MEATISAISSTVIEPVAGYGAFSAEASGLTYLWRGLGPGLWSTTISIFDSYTEQWSKKNITGSPPPGLAEGSCAFLGDILYVWGGYDGSQFYNDLYSLNTSSDSLEWNEAKPVDPLKGPICKAGCGLVAVNERTLACFGGIGVSALSRNEPLPTNEYEWTNEFHLFDVQTGVWSSPDIKGERPPPCASFSFIKVDQDRAVLFGGRQPGRGRVDDLYLFNFRNMEVNRVEPVEGEQWPEGRSFHSACCLNNEANKPQLLVCGGLDNRNNVLADMWILDLGNRVWTNLKPLKAIKPRYWHSMTATSLGPGLTEVLVFGGCEEWPENWENEDEFTPIADTTILDIEFTSSPIVVDVTNNSTRGSSQRLREKMVKIRRAAYCASTVREAARQLLKPKNGLRVSCHCRTNGLTTGNCTD